jgi:hypothetical protein
MSDPATPLETITPSDAVLLASECSAPAPGAWFTFKRKALSQGPALALAVAVLGGLAPLGVGLGFLVPIDTPVSDWALVGIMVALIVGAAGIARGLRRTVLSNFWKRVQASEARFSGCVKPLQRGHEVLEEPLALALVSTALLANEEAGMSQLVLAEGVLDAVPTGTGVPWPRDSLEDRLRRNRRLAVQELVSDWLAAPSQVPFRRAVQLAEQGLVTRGLAVLSDTGHTPQALLTDTATPAADAIDGSAARRLLETCRQERPEVWEALQRSLCAAFEQRQAKREYAYSWGMHKVTEVALTRDAPLAVKIVKQQTTHYASDIDTAPVQMLEAAPAAVASAPEQPETYATQQAIAARLPAWALALLKQLKRWVSPSSAEVQAAIKSRLQTQRPAATKPRDHVDTAAAVPAGQRSTIPARLFESTELPAPTAAQRRQLDRSGRDWARMRRREDETLWLRWMRRRARARLLPSVLQPYRLLMLRVFGSPSYDDLIELIQPWRRVGVIQHLEGFDTIGTRPEAIAALKAGRIEDILVETRQEVERRLAALSLAPDDELLFERQAFQCTDTTWQVAVLGMMDEADAVVMDLSSLSPTNQGCAWEIGQLLDRVPLSRVTLLVNDSTDLQCLQAILDEAARHVSPTSPNREDPAAIWRLVRIGGLSARQPNESYFDWKRRVDTRLDPETLTSFLVTSAEPRRRAAHAPGAD